MEEYTEKQRMEGYIDFSVGKENGRVYREAKNWRVYRLLCRERHGRVHREATNGRVYRLLCRERKWKSIQRSKELEGI